MGVWDHLKPEQLAGASAEEMPNGLRVLKRGRLSFVRSGVARVNWDDGTTTEDWAADLERED